jgi:hypothetical protein
MMKLPYKTNRMILRLVVALALFAQGVIPASAYAVMAAAVSPMGRAPASSTHDGAAHGMPGMACHQDAGASSSCLTHCSQSDQFSLDHAQLAALPVGTAVLHVLLPLTQGLSAGVPATAEPHLAASPPLSILYCSLQN